MRPSLIAALLVPLAMFAAAVTYDRIVILNNAKLRLILTTDALAAQAEAVLQSAELALSLELTAIKDMDWPSVDQSAEVHRLLVTLTKQLPQIHSAFLVTPDGFNSASSRSFPMPHFDVRDREYYRLPRQGNMDVVISAPFRGRAQGEEGFTVSRARVTGGRFDGVAAVTLTPESFGHLYRDVLGEPEASAVALVRRDGSVLAGFPPAMSPVLAPGSPVMHSATKFGDGIYRPISGRDGRAKLVNVHWLPGRDVFVLASLDLGRVLNIWYAHVVVLGAFALIAALALSTTVTLAIRRAEQAREAAEALLAETQRRQEAEKALQQAQKLDALGRLTGGVAHDFNNLLTAVLGSLQLVLRRVTDPSVQRLVNVALKAAERGARLTAQMLAFARNRTLTVQAVDVDDVLRDMDELLRRSVGPLVRLEYRLNAAWPVLVDRVQLELAVLNLVANARDAMEEGGLVLIATRDVSAEREQVLISVSDTGTGMSAEVVSSAFEPFFTTKDTGKGTGLGLSMVYGFAKQAGGSVAIDSAPNIGTTVTISLPRATGVPSVSAVAKQTPPLPHELAILLVDDDATAREPTEAMLRELGCVVAVAPSAAEALEILRSDARFDVLLLDYAMPEMNGARLADLVRQMRPMLPIVFITGYAEDELLERLHPLGARVLTKPFTLDALLAALGQAAAEIAAD